MMDASGSPAASASVSGAGSEAFAEKRIIMQHLLNKSRAVLDLKQKLESKGINCAIYDFQIGLIPQIPLEQQPNELETIIANMQGHLLKVAKPQAVSAAVTGTTGSQALQSGKASSCDTGAAVIANQGRRRGNRTAVAAVYRDDESDEEPRRHVHQRGPIRKDVHERVEKFVRFAVEFLMGIGCSVGGDLEEVTMTQIVAAYGQNCMGMFTHRYTSIGVLRESARSGSADLALKNIGADRKATGLIPLEEILEQKPNYRPAAEFCQSQIRRRPKIRRHQLITEFKRSSGENIASLFASGAFSMAKLRGTASRRSLSGGKGDADSSECTAEESGSEASSELSEDSVAKNRSKRRRGGGGGGGVEPAVDSPATSRELRAAKRRAGGERSSGGGGGGGSGALAEHGTDEAESTTSAKDCAGDADAGNGGRNGGARDGGAQSGAAPPARPSPGPVGGGVGGAAAGREDGEDASGEAEMPTPAKDAAGAGAGALAAGEAAGPAAGGGEQGPTAPDGGGGGGGGSGALSKHDTDDDAGDGSRNGGVGGFTDNSDLDSDDVWEGRPHWERPPKDPTPEERESWYLGLMAGRREQLLQQNAAHLKSLSELKGAVGDGSDGDGGASKAAAGGGAGLPRRDDHSRGDGGGATGDGRRAAAAAPANADTLLQLNDAFDFVLTSTRNEAGQEKLQREGCAILVGEESLCFDLDWTIGHVAENGSCCAAAVLRAVAKLDVDKLREHVSRGVLDGLETWVEFGRTLLDGGDADCTGFRLHACQTMLASKQQIRSLFGKGVTNHDTTQKHFKEAMATAKQNGCVIADNKAAMDNVEQWAVAILHPRTHLTEEVVRALLDVHAKGLGILVATCADVEGKRQFILHPFQPWVSATDELFIAVAHLSKVAYPEDAQVEEEVSRPRRACAHQPSQEVRNAIQEQRKKQCREQHFFGAYNMHHFEQATINNGVGGAIVRQLDSRANGLEGPTRADTDDAPGSSGGGGREGTRHDDRDSESDGAGADECHSAAQDRSDGGDSRHGKHDMSGAALSADPADAAAAAAAAVDAANPAAVDATAETAGPPAAPAAAVNATVFTQKQLLDVYDSCSPEPPKSLRLLLRKADVLHRANLTNEPALDDEGVDVEARNNAARDICLQLFELPPLQDMSAEETEAFKNTVNKKVKRMVVGIHPDQAVNFCRRHNINNNEAVGSMLRTAATALNKAREFLLDWVDPVEPIGYIQDQSSKDDSDIGSQGEGPSGNDSGWEDAKEDDRCNDKDCENSFGPGEEEGAGYEPDWSNHAVEAEAEALLDQSSRDMQDPSCFRTDSGTAQTPGAAVGLLGVQSGAEDGEDQQSKPPTMSTGCSAKGVSRETVAQFLQLTMSCPLDKEIFSLMVANSKWEVANSLCLYRYRCSFLRSQSRSLSEDSEGGRIQRALDVAEKDAKKSEERREALLWQAGTYIQTILISSCLAESKELFQRALMRWMDKFIPSATAILGPLGSAGAEILGPILATVQLLPPTPDAACPSGGDDVRGVAVVPAGGQGSAFAGFRNMKGRCYNCRQSSASADLLACVVCGGNSCKVCFGAGARGQKGKHYVCNWCLHGYLAENGNGQLMRPVKGRLVCFLCHCSLRAGFWCQIPAICDSSCGRQYCDRCLALTSLDLKKRNTKITIRKESFTFAVVDCILCVGRKKYAQNRRLQLEALLKTLCPAAGVASLLSGTGQMRRDELQRAPSQAIAFGELMAGLHWMGLRELFEEYLPVLMTTVQLQARPGQGTAITLSVSPLDMMYYLRPSTPGKTTLATPELLEMLCVAHAAAAEKKGQALMDKIRQTNPALQIEFVEGQRIRVAFVGPDLFQPGPTNNMVGEAIRLFSDHYSEYFDVWVLGDGEVDLSYPPVKTLYDHFDATGRLIVLDSEEESVLAKFLEFKPNVVFSFPGWTHGDRAWLLFALTGLGVLTINLIGFPGAMHFPSAVTVTLVGPAVGKGQLSSKTRERFALIGSGDTYQPCLSHPHLDHVKVESRGDWGLPEDGFILLFSGTTNRVGEKTAYLFFDQMCTPEFDDAFLVFLDRPETMRLELERLREIYIEAKRDDSDLGGNSILFSLRDRILFRPFSDGSPRFYSLIDAALHGKGGMGIRAVSISSFDSMAPHSTAQEVLQRGMVMFATENQDGLMADRVAAEVLKAAGLGRLCVGQSDSETLEKLRQYKRSPVLQKRAHDHLKWIKDRRLGLFNSLRAPETWKAVVDHYYSGDRSKLGDFIVPPTRHAAPVLAVDSHGGSAASLDEIMKGLKGTEAEMESLTRDFLTGFASETGVEFVGVTGAGSYVNTICCRQSDGKLGALKLGKKSRQKDRLDNDPVLREAALLERAHAQMRKCDIKIFPEPYYVLEKGTSFAGTTLADAQGRVLSFLFCEFVEKDFANTFAHHAELFQATGKFDDTLRLECFRPFLLAMYQAHTMGYYILDIKPNNVRIGENGRVVFTDLNLGHYFSEVKGGPNAAPCLLTRKCTTLLEQDHAAATGRQRRLKKGMLQGRRPKRDGRFVPITRADFRAFWQKLTHGLADLRGGARDFQDPRMTAKAKDQRRNLIVGARALKEFDRKWALGTDIYAAYTTLLLLLTKKKGEAFSDWRERATEAIQDGSDGIQKLFLASMNPGVIVQQELALAKMVDLFELALRPGENPGCDEFALLTHLMNTTPILTPEHEQTLRSGGGIPVGGGYVRDMFGCPHENLWDQKLPLLEYALQPGMGLGVRTKEDIPAGAVVGPYAGRWARPTMLGEKCCGAVASRYQVTSQGNIPLLKELRQNKLACDAQPDTVRDFQWAVINGNSGPYFNAGKKVPGEELAVAGSDDEYYGDAANDTATETGSDDEKTAKANCTLDRVRVWGFPKQSKGHTPELLCMLMISSRKILKGEFLMWPYNPKAAGGGRSFFQRAPRG